MDSMGKSIRSKTKKESRTQLRKTIGENAAQKALTSTQAKLQECINQKTTSIDRLAKLFNTEDKDGDKVMIIDSAVTTNAKEGNDIATAKKEQEIDEDGEEEVYADTTRVPGKKYEKIIKRKHGVYKEKKAKQLVAKIVRRRRMMKPGQMLRF